MPIDRYRVFTCCKDTTLEEELNKIVEIGGEIYLILSNMAGNGLVYTVIYTE